MGFKEICEENGGEYQINPSDISEICYVDDMDKFYKLMDNRNWYGGVITYYKHTSNEHKIYEYHRRKIGFDDNIFIMHMKETNRQIEPVHISEKIGENRITAIRKNTDFKGKNFDTFLIDADTDWGMDIIKREEKNDWKDKDIIKEFPAKGGF